MAAVTLAALPYAPTAGAGTTASTVGELPTVTFDKTMWRVGERVRVSGTGCVDPDTGSGAGLVVTVNRSISFGRGGYGPLKVIDATVNADGSFTGTGTIEQPMTPEGIQDVTIECDKSGGTALLMGVAKVTVIAPSLPDLTVEAGRSFKYVMPCSISGGEYGYFGFSVDAEHGFGLPGRFPYALSPKQGDLVTIEVPADTPIGTFRSTAGCGVSQSGTNAYFAHFTVTVKPAQALTTGIAGPAQPVSGTANFAG